MILFLKKIAQTSKNCHFWPNFNNNGVPMGHNQTKKHFFSEIKTDHKLSKTFYFIKIYVLAELLSHRTLIDDYEQKLIYQISFLAP